MSRRVPRPSRHGQAGHEGPHLAAPTDPFRDANDTRDVVVVEDAVRRVDRRLLVARGIPGDRQPRRHVVMVLRERVRTEPGHVVLDVGPELVLVPHAKFERQVGLHPPVVLRKQRNVLVDVGTERLAIALDIACGKPERDGLNAADRHGQQTRNGRQRREDVASTKVQRKPPVRVVDVVEIEAGFQLVTARVVADRIEHLVAIAQPRLRSESLPTDARDAEHFERGTALTLLDARAAAIRIKRGNRLIAARELETQFVHHLLPDTAVCEAAAM